MESKSSNNDGEMKTLEKKSKKKNIIWAVVIAIVFGGITAIREWGLFSGGSGSSYESYDDTEYYYEDDDEPEYTETNRDLPSYSFLDGKWTSESLVSNYTRLGMVLRGGKSGRCVFYEFHAMTHEIVWQETGSYEAEGKTIYISYDEGDTGTLTIVSESKITDGSYTLTK